MRLYTFGSRSTCTLGTFHAVLLITFSPNNLSGHYQLPLERLKRFSFVQNLVDGHTNMTEYEYPSIRLQKKYEIFHPSTKKWSLLWQEICDTEIKFEAKRRISLSQAWRHQSPTTWVLRHNLFRPDLKSPSLTASLPWTKMVGIRSFPIGKGNFSGASCYTSESVYLQYFWKEMMNKYINNKTLLIISD